MWFDTLILQLRLHMAYRVNGILYRLRFLRLPYENSFAKTLGLVLAVAIQDLTPENVLPLWVSDLTGAAAATLVPLGVSASCWERSCPRRCLSTLTSCCSAGNCRRSCTATCWCF